MDNVIGGEDARETWSRYQLVSAVARPSSRIGALATAERKTADRKSATPYRRGVGKLHPHCYCFAAYVKLLMRVRPVLIEVHAVFEQVADHSRHWS